MLTWEYILEVALRARNSGQLTVLLGLGYVDHLLRRQDVVDKVSGGGEACVCVCVF